MREGNFRRVDEEKNDDGNLKDDENFASFENQRQTDGSGEICGLSIQTPQRVGTRPRNKSVAG
jgi:hypothetical protein